MSSLCQTYGITTKSLKDLASKNFTGTSNVFASLKPPIKRGLTSFRNESMLGKSSPKNFKREGKVFGYTPNNFRAGKAELKFSPMNYTDGKDRSRKATELKCFAGYRQSTKGESEYDMLEDLDMQNLTATKDSYYNSNSQPDQPDDRIKATDEYCIQDSKENQQSSKKLQKPPEEDSLLMDTLDVGALTIYDSVAISARKK